MVAQGEILSNRYLLLDEIGSGGMGTVYRATDLRTNAQVAVKVPHPFLVRDSVYIERLKREAQFAAALHSPRIALVTDFSEHEGTPYLVMEYVPGETIADILDRDGAISAPQALRVTLEVARALDAAHQRGICHRDLKPQNIRIDEGDVKVLDFGIARLEGQIGLTSAGTLMGSPEYIAPERAEGAGDIRSDIYSLGIVLYQMLTGRVPFDGGTPWTLMRRHAQEPPAPLPPGLPAAVYPIVDRCLAKRPEDRYQTPRELTAALHEALRTVDPNETGGFPLTQSPGSTNTPVPPTIVADGLRSPGTPPPGVAISRRSGNIPGQTDPTMILQATRLPSSEFEAPPAPPAAAPPAAPPPPVAPARGGGLSGGRIALLVGAGVLLLVIAVVAVVLVSRGGGGDSKAKKDATAAGGLSGMNATGSGTSATGGSGAEDQPKVEFAFPADGAKVTMPLRMELKLTGVTLRLPADGDPNGRHLHYFIDNDPAAVISPGAPVPPGTSTIVHTIDTNYVLNSLPPGDHTVWVVVTGNDHIPLQPPVQAKVTFNVSGARARSGEEAPIVYETLSNNKWRIFRMDGAGRNPTQLSSGNSNDVEPSWSPDGSKIVFSSDRDGGAYHLFVMDANGAGVQQLTRGPANDRNPVWSPDGSRIAFHSNREGGKDQIFVIPAGGGEAKQVTRTPADATEPTWSPDGKQIAFQSLVGNGTHIFVVSSDGGEAKQITSGNHRHIDPAWSPDGRKIAFAGFDRAWNLYIMNADGSDAQPLTNDLTNEEQPRYPNWSPDGLQIVFGSGRTGQPQIYRLPLQGGGRVLLTEGLAQNRHPSWPRR